MRRRNWAALLRSRWHEEPLVELNGANSPIGFHDRIARLRSFGYLAIGLALVVNTDLSETAPIAIAILIGAVLPLASAMVIKLRYQWELLQLTTDLATAICLVWVMPEYFQVTLMGMMALAILELAYSPVRRALPASVIFLISIGIATSIADPGATGRTVTISGVVMLLIGTNAYFNREDIRRSQQDLRAAVHAAGGLTHITDVETTQFDIQGDVESVLGYTRGEWKRLHPRDAVHPDDLADVYATITEAKEGEIVVRAARFRHKNGSWVWLRDVSRVALHDGRLSLHGFSIDVTAERIGLAEVTSQATTDELTGLPNRRVLVETLDEDGRDTDVLVLIDLDRFKDVNDTMGHDAGDRVLCEVAERLERCVRPGDLLARLGGDEFAILMRDFDDLSPVTAAVDRLALEIERPIDLNGVLVTTAISAGIAVHTKDENRSVTMLRNADIAMYTAKRNHQNSVVFDDTLQDELDLRVALLEGLTAALEDGSLGLHYQPIVDTATGSVVGAEGLARWQHPTFGLLYPNAFLDAVLLSERSGEFTKAMVSHALRTWKHLDNQGLAVPISVNIPVPVFEDPTFCGWFETQRATLECSNSSLILEIAEGDRHHADDMRAAIERFSTIGVPVSLDDFGTGHATFERLRWWNVAQLKLERVMVAGAAQKPREQKILASVAELANGLGYEIVAEGVETTEELEMLQRLGVAKLQGWLFSKAVPADELMTILEDNGYTTHAAFKQPIET